MRKEDTFHYEIAEDCIRCGRCEAACPVHAISESGGRLAVDSARCIDCGTCASVCPVRAAGPQPVVRESIPLSDIDWNHCYFNAGCALNLYRPDTAKGLLALLQAHFPTVRPHTVCCRYDPAVGQGATIINNCAGCDRRFRSLYSGVRTISCWELLDTVPNLTLPDHTGLTVSVHDSCGYRHKPQVHAAVRSLLRKMNIQICEAALHGTDSVCCGDNLYGHVPNDAVEIRIKQRAGQFPCAHVVVYCIGCVRAMESGGKIPLYLPDLILGKEPVPMPDTLDLYHARLSDYIMRHQG